MQIANVRLIENFKRRYAGSRVSIEDWANKTFAANWAQPGDVREIFSSASFVKDFVIFNIGGNKYRLLTRIFYKLKVVDILKVGTHEDYDRWKL
jgi:mRNA interferase HigB